MDMQQCVEVIGELLKAKHLVAILDGWRKWIWVVRGTSALTASAYVPFPAEAETTTEDIGESINRLVQTDLADWPINGCHWNVVLCGVNATPHNALEVQRQVKPHFKKDQITVTTLGDVMRSAAKAQARDILIRQARRGQDITFTDLASEIHVIKFAPNDTAFFNLIGDVSRDEHESGFPLLSVLVVGKGSNEPGKGFYVLAKELGFPSDRANFRQVERQRVIDYWTNR